MTFLSEKSDRIEIQDLEKLFQFADDLILEALRNELAIPHIDQFKRNLEIIFRSSRMEPGGKVSNETQFLSKQSPDLWALSVCSVSGQVINYGDTSSPFILDRCSRPILFALGTELLGLEKVQIIIGMNYCFVDRIDILDKRGVPANLVHEAGGFALSSWIRNVGLDGKTDSEIFEYVDTFIKNLGKRKHVKFNNTAYMAQREELKKNKAIVYYLRSNNCLPVNNDPEKDFDFYLTIGSYEVDSESLALIGAVIANYGDDPYTEENRLTTEICQHTIAMMSVCAPQKNWPFQVSLPASSGQSGCLLTVFPGIMAIALFSPKLDQNGCSLRAMKFIEAFSQVYSFHRFDDTMVFYDSEPQSLKTESECPYSCWIYSAAMKKDIFETVNIICGDVSVCQTNYFGRTVLHEAATAGHLECVKLLISACPRLLDVQDISGHTPMDDAIYFGHSEVVKYFEKWYMLQTGKPYQREAIDN